MTDGYAFGASWRAHITAEQWGEWVKATFDVYLPVLCHKLGYKKRSSVEEERKFWLSLSQGMMYRDLFSLKDLDKLRGDAFD